MYGDLRDSPHAHWFRAYLLGFHLPKILPHRHVTAKRFRSSVTLIWSCAAAGAHFTYAFIERKVRYLESLDTEGDLHWGIICIVLWGRRRLNVECQLGRLGAVHVCGICGRPL